MCKSAYIYIYVEYNLYIYIHIYACCTAHVCFYFCVDTGNDECVLQLAMPLE